MVRHHWWNSTTFERVVKQERDGYDRTLEGIYGDEKIAEAKKLGLDGICYITTERGSNMLVEDAITGKKYRLPLKWWSNMSGLHSGYWYSRLDRDQFEITGELQTTAYERKGKVYDALVPCAWCSGTNPKCTRCNGSGMETIQVRNKREEQEARRRIDHAKSH